MSKMDSESRLKIPADLLKKIGWSLPLEIAICYDFSSKTLTICNSSDIVNKNVIAIRKVDQTGRFILPKESFSLLGVNKDSEFLIYLRNNDFIIRDMTKIGI